MYDHDDFFNWDDEDNGRFVQAVSKLGTSFILFVSALLSVSFYVTAGAAVFDWLPQDWMSITAAIILGLTGNELSVSLWLTVRARAKQITSSQSTVVQTGIVAGAVTATLTTLASFIVTPETSPYFLAEYSQVIAFLMMSLPVIIQTLIVMGFLAFTREAELASKQAKTWGNTLKTMSKAHETMNKGRLIALQDEIRLALPEFSQEVGKHDAGKLITQGKRKMIAEQEAVRVHAETAVSLPEIVSDFSPVGEYKTGLRVCQNCGKKLAEGRRKTQKYCSVKCRNQAAKKRQRIRVNS